MSGRIKGAKKLRIAMLGHKKIPSREGGVEVVVEELSTRMAEAGHDVTCYNRRERRAGKEKFEPHEIAHGVRLKSVPTLKGKGLAAATSSFFAAVQAAFGKYDIVHIHAEGPAFFCWIPKDICKESDRDGSRIGLEARKMARRFRRGVHSLGRKDGGPVCG